MKYLRLTAREIAALCRSLAHLYHAGIPLGDALALMAEDEPLPAHRTLLEKMSLRADEGAEPAALFREPGCFSDYLCALLEVGHRTGRVEETLDALADHYESRARMKRQLRDALLYPAGLLAVMLAVVLILLIRVLPIFEQVYIRLGTGLTGLAGGLLALGQVLKQALPLLALVLVLAVVAALTLVLQPRLRHRLAAGLRRLHGDRGMERTLNNARLTQALSLALASGATEQQALSLAAALAEGCPAFEARCARCLELNEAGVSLGKALLQNELLTRAECRMLETAAKSGRAEVAMAQLAARRLEESERALEQRAARIEPLMVIVLAVMAGMILLSVMLPLMQIMTLIG